MLRLAIRVAGNCCQVSPHLHHHVGGGLRAAALLLGTACTSSSTQCELPRRGFASESSRYLKMRHNKMGELAGLSEMKQNDIFLNQLKTGNITPPESAYSGLQDVGMTASQFLTLLDAGFCTQASHVESRVASYMGEGFYTIGPCGEELVGALLLAANATDGLALHYRHLSAQFVRQLRAGRSVDEILLARARANTVSTLDPVTGGVHCSIGGGPFDFLVTSTLASQATPAVGRALASQLAHALSIPCKFPKNFVSFVSVGDGSVNNAHFLSALNIAAYAQHREFRCPVVFGISDNNICISLRGYGWLDKFLETSPLPVLRANGLDALDIYKKSAEAFRQARVGRPVVLVFSNLPRRFGHAATDRQAAYFSAAEINAAADKNPLAGACAQAVKYGITTFAKLAERYAAIYQKTQEAFAQACEEPKISSREQQISICSQPKAPLLPAPPQKTTSTAEPRSWMRKHMTRVIEETLARHPQAVYIGEDVEHGGYYLVTEGLARKFPHRVRDFPPDETSLVGAAVGFAQAGLLPILEIPYAKYLDCGADMFFEAALMNWLSNGQQPNGMIVRLQGFDKGVFGGNFHTHNTLHTPPGVDVVCYSNGADYARGFRYAVRQALAGRIVMTVDSTHLLNLKHVEDGDDQWLRAYPSSTSDELGFDDVNTYHCEERQRKATTAVVTYGNGVVTALQAQKLHDRELRSHSRAAGDPHSNFNFDVIDCPYLSEVPNGLRNALKNYERVVFADVCKQRQAPLDATVTTLQREGLLPRLWQAVAAPRCYNPLGRTLTFLSVDDISGAVKSLCKH